MPAHECTIRSTFNCSFKVNMQSLTQIRFRLARYIQGNVGFMSPHNNSRSHEEWVLYCGLKQQFMSFLACGPWKRTHVYLIPCIILRWQSSDISKYLTFKEKLKWHFSDTCNYDQTFDANFQSWTLFNKLCDRHILASTKEVSWFNTYLFTFCVTETYFFPLTA